MPSLGRIALADDPLILVLGGILPFGGYVTIQCQAFFDESASHDGAPILCVAGYIFEKSEAIKLGREWRRVLEWKRLPYFRMSDCAHGNGPFANLTKDERIDVATRMIAIIKKRAVQGVAITMDNLQFLAATAEFPDMARVYRTPYGFCTHTILAGVACWLEANPRVGEMAYFFEQGHDSAAHSDAIMKEIFAAPGAEEQYRYAGHGFVPKRKSPAVQAADLLAWQWYKDKKNQVEGRPRRKDCASLLELHHSAAHVDRAGIEMVIEHSRKTRQFNYLSQVSALAARSS
jgi:uncharacterized protein DUF3800